MDDRGCDEGTGRRDNYQDREGSKRQERKRERDYNFTARWIDWQRQTERGGTERCRRREEQVMSNRGRTDWKRKCVWRRVRTVGEGESPCQRGRKRQKASAVDSFLSCVFFFCNVSFARLCSLYSRTHLRRHTRTRPPTHTAPIP